MIHVWHLQYPGPCLSITSLTIHDVHMQLMPHYAGGSSSHDNESRTTYLFLEYTIPQISSPATVSKEDMMLSIERGSATKGSATKLLRKGRREHFQL